MLYLKERIEHFSIWLLVCYNLHNYHHNFGRRRLAPLATFKIGDFIDPWGYKLLMRYGMITNLTLVIFKFLVVNAYAFVPNVQTNKLHPRATKSNFIGYREALGYKAYKLYNPQIKRIFFNHIFLQSFLLHFLQIYLLYYLPLPTSSHIPQPSPILIILTVVHPLLQVFVWRFRSQKSILLH